MKLKKLIALFLALMTLTGTEFLPALAEEAAVDPEGNVEFVYVDVTEEEEHPEFDEPVPDVEPYIPEELDRTIFGKDNRARVINPSNYPYCCMAKIVVTAKCGHSWYGTGFMVGKNKMLTAAHCMYCYKCSSPAKTATFYFGYNAKNGKYYYKTSSSVTFYVGTKFTGRDYTVVNDYAVIKFKSNVGTKTGWLGIRWNYAANKKSFNLAGYHAGILKKQKGKVYVLNNTHLKYTLDTQGGSSGGPLYDDDKYSVAINIAENSSYNMAHRLTTAVKKLWSK